MTGLGQTDPREIPSVFTVNITMLAIGRAAAPNANADIARPKLPTLPSLQHLRKSSLDIHPRKRFHRSLNSTWLSKTTRCNRVSVSPAGAIPGWLGSSQLVGMWSDGSTTSWSTPPCHSWRMVADARPHVAHLDSVTLGGRGHRRLRRRTRRSTRFKSRHALERVRGSSPQKTMQNSFQQAQNVMCSFAVVDQKSGPVLLLDDVVDFRWTLTIVAAQLLSAGSGPLDWKLPPSQNSPGRW